jgi:hypothetical protein
MPNDDVLRRIDRSLEGIEWHVGRGNELMDENRKAIDENRTFMRELLLRHERVTNAMVRQLEANTRAINEQRREFVDEMRAQRAALFRLLDRLDGGADPAGA